MPSLSSSAAISTSLHSVDKIVTAAKIEALSYADLRGTALTKTKVRLILRSLNSSFPLVQYWEIPFYERAWAVQLHQFLTTARGVGTLTCIEKSKKATGTVWHLWYVAR